jgi:nucleoside-triphosphatase THEP1
MSQSLFLIGAVLFDPEDEVDRLLRTFAQARKAEGVDIAGFVQSEGNCEECHETVSLLDLETGEHHSILQDLGPLAQSCRVDTAALAALAPRLRRAIERSCDLIVINRFGKLEAARAGFAAEIGAAAIAGIPLLIPVPKRLVSVWAAFSGGLGEPVPCSLAGLERWWSFFSPRGPAREGMDPTRIDG